MFKRLTTAIAAALLPGFVMLAATTDAQAQVHGRTLRVSLANSKGHPQNMGAEKFAELVAARSGGKIQVKLFPGGVLGPDLQGISAMQGGTLDMMVGTVNLLAGNVKEFAVLDFPFLFRSAEEADAIVDGPIGKQLFDKLTARGVVGLAYLELGFRGFHIRTRPIRTAEDFGGLKLRVQPTPLYVDLVNAWGANAVPMPFPETYSALEQGAIDGMSNPLINIVDGKYYEVSRYVTITNHIYQPSWLGMSKKVWDKLSPDEQKIIKESADEARLYQRKVSRDMAAKALDELRKQKVEIVEMPPAELAKLREKAKPVVAKHTQLAGPEFVAEVQRELDKIRAGKP